MPLPTTTSARDRTGEFNQLVELFTKQLTATGALANGNGAGRPTAPDRSQQIQQHSEFARRAAQIGHGIQNVSQKLQKLTQLAKRTSMFDDPASEVDQLTGLIKSDIQALQISLGELQHTITHNRSGASKQSEQHSTQVVSTLSTRLADTTKTFTEALTFRSDNLKHHRERRQIFSSNEAEASMPLLQPRQPQPQHHQPYFSGNGLVASSSTAVGTPTSQQQAPLPSFLQTQQQLTITAPQETYMSSRAVALQNVEQAVAEIGQIYGKLSELVVQQGEMAIRIDENVDDALTNVNNAQAQLLKYLNTISSNRWLIMKVFAVLLVFMVLFIMFIA